mgnify:CR=1 FL=1
MCQLIQKVIATENGFVHDIWIGAPVGGLTLAGLAEGTRACFMCLLKPTHFVTVEGKAKDGCFMEHFRSG